MSKILGLHHITAIASDVSKTTIFTPKRLIFFSKENR